MYFRQLLTVAALALLVAAVLQTAAQSRRVRPVPADPKPDPRAEAPTPTPTPIQVVEGEEEAGVIRIDTRLVTIPVRVIDRKGRFVGGLGRESFRVFEDNVEQQIEHFSNEAQPFTVVLVLDMSYSTRFKIGEIQSAAISFIDQLRPDDRVIVVSFDEEVMVHCEPTSDRRKIFSAIRKTQIGTGTSLYEAVDHVMNVELRAIEGRKAIVLFTDGVDTTSRRSHDLENLRDAQEIDALIYPIRYDTFADVQTMKNRPVVMLPDSGPKGTPPISPSGGRLPLPLPVPAVGTPGDRGTTIEEYEHGREYLERLALWTGGTIYLADTVGNLNRAYARIASELREFYSLGYYPKEFDGRGRTRRIKVKVDRANVAVRARDSYVVSENRKN